ncbi:MAG: CPBP family intramembrane metalloprotease [Pseudonocardiaceae bacterium]|nr:CPBP family intramembrane metalloprotease [Pseudonocardiaceae bacterium]
MPSRDCRRYRGPAPARSIVGMVSTVIEAERWRTAWEDENDMSESIGSEPVGEHSIGDRGRVGVGDPDRPALGWTEIVVGVAAFVLLNALVIGSLIAFVGATPPILLAVLASAVTALGAVAIAAALRVRSITALGVRAVSWRWVWLGVGAGVVAWLINRGVILAYIAITGDTTNPQQGLAEAASGSVAGLVGMLALGSVLVPLGEELLFRGVIYGGLRRYGVVVATLGSAAVFGLAHGISVVLAGAVVVGVITALVYEWSRSIWPAVVAHGVNNAIIFLTAAVLLG